MDINGDEWLIMVINGVALHQAEEIPYNRRFLLGKITFSVAMFDYQGANEVTTNHRF